ncbi:hypothetical protein IQ238_10165 [Pleurocapsales cyanobacterium LEGE 06147]|nr:hypothetical protein [Pleurocapsales cyanobacterium LEGE 06147]
MKVYWQKLFILTFVWLLSEVFLGFLGLDDLADYGEFVFSQKVIVLTI